MEPKSETKLKYDSRRKILVQTIYSCQEIKMGDEVVGKSVMERESTFDESGIINVLKDLSNQRTKLEQEIKSTKDNLKDVGELTLEEKELEEKIQKINSFNKSKQMRSQMETKESELKGVKKDISDIKNSIGTRLKI